MAPASKSSTTPGPQLSYSEAFPGSSKVYDEHIVTMPHGDVTLRVPMREVSLSNGDRPVRLYDSSGPQGHDPREGLPRLRESWVAPRRGQKVVTQLLLRLSSNSRWPWVLRLLPSTACCTCHFAR